MRRAQLAFGSMPVPDSVLAFGIVLVFGLVPASAPSARGDTLTFQQGVNGYASTADTGLKQSQPNTPQSASTRFEWDTDDPSGTGLKNYALIRFDDIFGAAAEQIPPGAQITHATLTYEVTNAGDVGTMYESAVSFSATTTYNNFGPVPGVQANDLGSLVDETVGGIGIRTIEVTLSLAAWSADPGNNLGWIIVPTDTNGVDVRSSESSVLENRPILTVVINEGEPTPILVRQPYLQKGTESSMVVAWKTNLPAASRVRYGSSPASLDVTLDNAAQVTDHAMQIDGLQPGTRYFYEVGTDANVLAGGDADHFFDSSPAADESQPFSVWVVGDSGTGGSAQADVRDAMLNQAGGNEPDIFVHVGDMAYTQGTTTEFSDNFFTPYAEILRQTVCWPTLGNHEGDSSSSSTQTGPYYEAYILPTGGEAGGIASGTEAYYSFDYANAHFVCLDSHETSRSPGSPMLTWLEEDINATDREWLIAFWHHPPYTKGTHDSDDVSDSTGRMRDMRQNVLPILEDAGVDLVLAGHSHIYERSFLVDGAYDTPTTATGHIIDSGDGRETGNGPYIKPLGRPAHRGAVYVVAGHGGQSTGGSGNHPLMYFSETENGSCILDFNGPTLRVKNIRHDGVISDTFTLLKLDPVPASSLWGALLMALLITAAAMIVFLKPRRDLG